MLQSQKIAETLAAIRRPRLLIRAARFGIEDYNRDRDLRRLFSESRTPSPVTAVRRLLEAEAEMEEIRQAGDAGYSPARHIQVLVALISEARLVPAEA